VVLAGCCNVYGYISRNYRSFPVHGLGVPNTMPQIWFIVGFIFESFEKNAI